MRKTLTLKRETIAELATTDLLLVAGGAAIPPLTQGMSICYAIERLKAETAVITAAVTTAGITDMC